MENMEDIVATVCVETRRAAVRSTDWLDESIWSDACVTVRASQAIIIEGSQVSLRVTRNESILRGHDLPLPCAL